MCEALLMGGPYDGCRMPIHPAHESIKLPSNMKLPISPGDERPKRGFATIETYSKSPIAYNGREMNLYLHSSLSKESAFFRLFERYPENKIFKD